MNGHPKLTARLAIHHDPFGDYWGFAHEVESLIAERDALLEDKRRLDALAEMKADLIFLVDGYFVEDEGDGEYKWSADIRTAIDNAMSAK